MQISTHETTLRPQSEIQWTGEITLFQEGNLSNCGREWRIKFLPLALLQHQKMYGLKILYGNNAFGSGHILL